MLVVGLGNPGPRYADSPHNVGFRVVDHFAGRHADTSGASGSAWTPRFDAELCMATVDAEPLVLLKPMTYMNRSGESVRQAMAFFEIAVEQALVVHDELDLPFGSLRLKRGGGEAGHNGLKSISAQLGTRDYARLRIGVGRPPAGEGVRDFLLAPLASSSAAELAQSLPEADAAIELWVRDGIERAMNLVNRKVTGETPGRSEGQPD